MKMMKKAFALLLALAMLLSLSVTALAEEPTPPTYTITINNGNAGHTYTAYQIFAGDLKTTGEGTAAEHVLSNVTWGSAISETDAAAFLTALKSNTKFEIEVETGKENAFKDCDSARKVAEVLGQHHEFAAEFAKAVAPYAKTAAGFANTPADNKYTITGLKPGYYFVKDEQGTDGVTDAVSSYILEVVYNVDVTPKSAIPSVDKQVLDEENEYDSSSTGDKGEDATNTNGWGETADRALYQSFQFKLTATIEPDEDLADYETYKVVFHDTLSKGVTFENIASVKVDGQEPALTNEKYTLSEIATDEDGIKTFTITIENIIPYLKNGNTLDKGATIEVIYNAYLNDDAVMAPSDANQNTVYLEYSNNPNASGEGNDHETGDTTTDTVFVFTYEMPNTKYKDNATIGNEMEGAGFNLYLADGTTEVELVAVTEGTGENQKVLYYRPINKRATTPAETKVDHMVSGKDGKFDIRGLNEGVYWLKETVTPEGYNTCEDLKIWIDAVHTENTDGTSATDTFEIKQWDKKGNKWSAPLTDGNKIVNLKGTELPSTGGIGTTLFYVIGGGLMIGALVLLVTKKKMGEA